MRNDRMGDNRGIYEQLGSQSLIACLLLPYKGAFTADETIHAMTRRDDNEAIQRGPWDADMGYNDNDDNNNTEE